MTIDLIIAVLYIILIVAHFFIAKKLSDSKFRLGYWIGRRDEGVLSSITLYSLANRQIFAVDEMRQVVAQQIEEQGFDRDNNIKWDGIDRIALFCIGDWRVNNDG